MSGTRFFSYEEATIHGFDIGGGLQIRVKAINSNVASMYVTDAQGNQRPVPANVVLRDAEGAKVPVWRNSFLTTWSDSYVLTVGGVEVLRMTNPRQQAFATATGVTHFTV